MNEAESQEAKSDVISGSAEDGVLEIQKEQKEALPGGIANKFGRYHIEKFLGEGAFAHVYLARDHLDRPVALKVLKKQFSFDPAFIPVFKREATTSARLNNHDNIILIYNQDEIEGQFFIAMEYAPEGTLHDYIMQREHLSRSEIKTFVQQIADALDTAHQAGIVHRDVKPSNILLGYNNKIKLADFGIARVARPEATVRVSTTIQGTGAYMAPEQADPSAKIDHHVDIYALGVVIYQMFSGELPFGHDKTLGFVDLIQEKRTRKPKELTKIPSYVFKVIQKALNVQPDYRQRSAGDFASELIKAIEEWESSTEARQDKHHLAGLAVLAMEQEEWQTAKECWEGVLKIGASKVAERNLAVVKREIALQDAWTMVAESFDKAEWQKAIDALKYILEIEPDNNEAPAKLEEANKQIELQQLYAEGETAFFSEDYAGAMERFEAIYAQAPDYRDVAERLEEAQNNNLKEELTRIREKALFALVEGDIEFARQQAEDIKKQAPQGQFGADNFLKRFNNQIERVDHLNQQNIETTSKLGHSLEIAHSRIDAQEREIKILKGEFQESEEKAGKNEVLANDLQKELADRLYAYVTDLQEILGHLESNVVMRHASRDFIPKLREKIREIALRGQQVETVGRGSIINNE